MEEPPLTKIQIKMSNIEVIEINTDTLKLNLDFEVTWNEYRLSEWINTSQSFPQRVILRPADRDLIWSPGMVLSVSAGRQSSMIVKSQWIGRLI